MAEDLQIVVNQKDLVLKKDFEKLASELIKLIKTAVSSFDGKTTASAEAFRRTLAQAQEKIDSLFVKDRMSAMEKKHGEAMAMTAQEHKKMMEDMMAKMEKAMEKKMKEMEIEVKMKAVPGKPGPKGEPGSISLELAREAIEPIWKEMKGDWDAKVQSLVDSRKMSGATPHNLTQYIDVSSQADGSNRTFTGIPNARHIPMIFLSGQNPVVLFNGTGFTAGRGQVVISNSVEAPQSGVGVYVQIIK